MASHLLYLLLFAFFVSLVFAVLMRDDTRSQLALGVRLFGAFVAAALVLGWAMYPLPR